MTKPQDMSAAQASAKIRNWKIFRLRGAYGLLNVVSPGNRAVLEALLDAELAALGAKSSQQLRDERYTGWQAL